MNQKGFVNIILIIVIIVAALVASGAVYYYINKQKAQAPVPAAQQQPQDETANWKIYRSTKYGIEFKYPTDFSLEPGDSEIRDFISIGLDNTKMIEGEIVGNDIGLRPYGINFDGKKSHNVQETIKAIPTSVIGGNVGPVEMVTFNNNNFTKVERFESYGKRDIFYFIKYPRDDLVLQIMVTAYPFTNPTTNTVINYENIIQQVLSTFTFIQVK